MNPKVDFKSKWYALNDEDEKSEFLKDVSAIANTVGLDGYIVIGYDTKTKKLVGAKISDSTKKDTEINQVLSKGIEGELFINIHDIKIDNKSLSAIHIPPQFNKPFSVRNYKKGGKDNPHRIFVRKGSANSIANRYDLDFIYYDKKNLVPEYGFDVMCQSVSFNEASLEVYLALIVENYGLKPLAITKIHFSALTRHGILYYLVQHNSYDKENQYIGTNPLIVKYNEIGKFPGMRGHLKKDVYAAREMIMDFPNVKQFVLHFVLSNGKVFEKTILRIEE